MFQSTRPRGARRHLTTALHIPRCVSIHGPARGATGGINPLTQGGIVVSIHAPARGATVPECVRVATAAYVSIHAPARGATA